MSEHDADFNDGRDGQQLQQQLQQTREQEQQQQQQLELGREQEQEQEQELGQGQASNSLYDLLGAEALTEAHAQEHHEHQQEGSGGAGADAFGLGLGLGLAAQGGGGLHGSSLEASFAELATSSFRNGAAMLSEPRGSSAGDVYRSVSAIDVAAQQRGAHAGESQLDRPAGHAFHDHGLDGDGFAAGAGTGMGMGIGMDMGVGMEQEQAQAVQEPRERLFARLRLEHTHFFVAVKDAAELADVIDAELARTGVDASFDAATFSWQGKFYPAQPAAAVELGVFANAVPAATAGAGAAEAAGASGADGRRRYVVEFLRRAGCCRGYNALFADVRQALLATQRLTTEDGRLTVELADVLPATFAYGSVAPNSAARAPAATAVASAVPRPLLSRGSSSDIDFEEDEDEDEDEEDNVPLVSDAELFAPLVELARSDFEDLHVQAVALIGHEVCKGNAERMVRAAPALLPLLVLRLTSSRNCEVRRHAAQALAGMAESTSCVRPMLEAGAAGALAQAAAADFAVMTAQVQRLAATALARLCEDADARPLVEEAVAPLRQTFQELARTCGDVRLRSTIDEVSNALAA